MIRPRGRSTAIHIGIDDTDTPNSPGTNQLARRLAAVLPPDFELRCILRHQLLFDPRIPYTSKNGSASLLVHGRPSHADSLVPILRAELRAHFEPGSDPGLCVAENISAEVVEFGRRCQREPVEQREARELARAAGIHLEGLGGTEDGVIGALAAVGLLASGDDGRVVHLNGWRWPDDVAGPQAVAAILARGIAEIRELHSERPVLDGTVDIGKRLRPSYRNGRVVLFVEPVVPTEAAGSAWKAVKLA